MSVLDRVPVDAITARTPDVDLSRMGRHILAVIGGLFFLLGWIPAKAARAAWWCGSAVVQGWVEAWGSAKSGDDS